MGSTPISSYAATVTGVLGRALEMAVGRRIVNETVTIDESVTPAAKVQNDRDASLKRHVFGIVQAFCR